MFKTIHDYIEFFIKKRKIISQELFRALWNQSTCLSFVEKGPLQKKSGKYRLNYVKNLA